MENIIITETEKKVFGDDGAVRLSLTMPCLQGKGKTPFTKAFNAYYQGISTGFTQFAGGALLKAATAAKTEEGFKPYGAVLKAVPCFENQTVAALYVDAAVTTGGTRRIHRISQLWHKGNGSLISFGAVFEKGAARGMLPLILKSAAARGESAAVPLYADWELRARKEFNKRQFYITPRGLVFFYQGGVLSNRPDVFPVHISIDAATPFIKQDTAAILWQGA